MIDWIKTITANKPIATAFGVAFSVWCLSKESNCSITIWITVIIFIVIFISYDVVVEKLKNIILGREHFNKLKDLSLEEKNC